MSQTGEGGVTLPVAKRSNRKRDTSVMMVTLGLTTGRGSAYSHTTVIITSPSISSLLLTYIHHTSPPVYSPTLTIHPIPSLHPPSSSIPSPLLTYPHHPSHPLSSPTLIIHPLPSPTLTIHPLLSTHPPSPSIPSLRPHSSSIPSLHPPSPSILSLHPPSPSIPSPPLFSPTLTQEKGQPYLLQHMIEVEGSDERKTNVDDIE
ncbi:hypothetical protein Pcinc_017782 [Petrolisthes cinctipes]|uniref:Uncharacterized protein n=1 Tax=Petrolisthes cinctipes TaxID=88211 RepID=A0AAE1FQ17_PETCI|nr:hypothetical protein Pcinc_017782 [Petrolisthes cinctipes]